MALRQYLANSFLLLETSFQHWNVRYLNFKQRQQSLRRSLKLSMRISLRQSRNYSSYKTSIRKTFVFTRIVVLNLDEASALVVNGVHFVPLAIRQPQLPTKVTSKDVKVKTVGWCS